MRIRQLQTMRRCKCEKLAETLKILRTGKPNKAQHMRIKRGHKAPSRGRAGYVTNEIPSASDVQHILDETPHTLFLTISRWACAHVNNLAVAVLFPNEPVLIEVPCDPEANEANFDGRKMARQEPMWQAVYRYMRIILTQNENKKIGFVNGMGCTVTGVTNGNIDAITDLGMPIVVHPIHDEHGNAHFPFRPGYASTLHKVQGATLAHVTVWFDLPGIPAAAYVALSRVEYDANWRFIGNPTMHHFTPAKFK